MVAAQEAGAIQGRDRTRAAARAAAADPAAASELIREQTLIASACAGNTRAFNDLVTSYEGLVYNTAYRILAHPDAAADATQETFLAAYRALAAFRGGSFKAWLLRIATNACYTQLRLKKHRPQISVEDVSEKQEYAPWLVAGHESPEEAILRDDLASTIEAAISRLPWDQRVVVVLSDVQGLSYEEIVEITRASLGTVKSRLSRARARLRDSLAAAREP